jgi:L-glyceraldehyde 3-phosphate reductase
MGALDTAVRQGKALYVGISSYDADHTREAAAILKDLGTPLLINQPSFSMLNRWIEREGLLDAVEELGVGAIGFTVLAQGLLTPRYLDGIPQGSRAEQSEHSDYGAFDSSWINDEVIGRIRELNAIAEKRGQSLPQMALAWGLRDPRMTSVLIGASSAKQVEQNVDALDNLDFSAEELAEIDRIVDFESGVDEWAEERTGKVGSGFRS